MKSIAQWLVVGAIVTLWSLSAQARTWSGVVVDARTGQPVKGATVMAGTQGRVDPFTEYKAVTGDNGRFRITWPEETWKRAMEGRPFNHYLRVQPPAAWRPGHPAGYWNVTVIRSSPTEVTVRLMPRNAFVKGRVLSAEDGKPLGGVWVNLGIRNPGADAGRYGAKHGTRTKDDGTFSIPLPDGAPPVGFVADSAAWPSTLFDVPAGLAPKGSEDFDKLLKAPDPMYDFAVMIGDTAYPIPRDRITTSINDRVHTYVVIRHPAKDKPAHAQPITAEQRGLPDAQTATTPPSTTGPEGSDVAAPATSTSGTLPNLSGEWVMIANSHRTTMKLDHQGGRLTGSLFNVPLREGNVLADGTVKFIRSGTNQVYTGRFSREPDGSWKLSGTFDCPVTRTTGNRWTATRRGSPSADPAPGPGLATPSTAVPAAPAAPGEPARVEQMTLQAGTRRAQPGETVTVPVWLIRGQKVANINVNLRYDPKVAAVVGNVAKGNLLGSALFEANARDAGLVRLGLAQSQDLGGTGTIAQIPFRATGKPGDRTTLRLEVATISSASGARPQIAVITGELVIVDSNGRIPGDVRGDGVLTARDAMDALKMSVGNLAVNMVADVDSDGTVTSRDATIILQRVVGRQ